MQHVLDAITAGDTAARDFANLEIPDHYRAATVHKDVVDMFEGIASKGKDPRKSIHVEDVALPELGPGEALVAVMASAINYNTVWTSIFEPVSTFGFLERYGRLSPLTKRHDLPYHVVGSDLAGVVLATSPRVTKWKPGTEVVARCLQGVRDRAAVPRGGVHAHRRGTSDIQKMIIGRSLLRDHARSPGRVAVLL